MFLKLKKKCLRLIGMEGRKINNWVRALSPAPSMYTTCNGKKYKNFKTIILKMTLN